MSWNSIFEKLPALWQEVQVISAQGDPRIKHQQLTALLRGAALALGEDDSGTPETVHQLLITPPALHPRIHWHEACGPKDKSALLELLLHPASKEIKADENLLLTLGGFLLAIGCQRSRETERAQALAYHFYRRPVDGG